MVCFSRSRYFALVLVPGVQVFSVRDRPFGIVRIYALGSVGIFGFCLVCAGVGSGFLSGGYSVICNRHPVSWQSVLYRPDDRRGPLCRLTKADIGSRRDSKESRSSGLRSRQNSRDSKEDLREMSGIPGQVARKSAQEVRVRSGSQEARAGATRGGAGGGAGSGRSKITREPRQT